MSEHVLIFDTTLRDGEQSPGATMNKQEKLQLARQLEKLGVDIIEAGFPASSEGDKEAVEPNCRGNQSLQDCGLGQDCRRRYRNRVACSGKGRKARHPHFHCHERYPPGAQAQDVAGRSDRQSRSGGYVWHDLCPIGWSSPAKMRRVAIRISCAGSYRLPVDDGAGTINIPDTVGYCFPEEMAERVAPFAKGARDRKRHYIRPLS